MTESNEDDPPSESNPSSPNSPPPSKKTVGFILATVMLDTIGFGIIAPVTPELITGLTGEGLDRAAIYGGWLLFLYALMQFVFAPILGNLSDRFGRRPILIGSLLAFSVDYMIMGFAPNLTWLFIGRALAGVAGATGATANAYVADVSDAKTRAQNFGMVGAAWGLGFIIGPVIGGLLGGYGPRVPFFVAAGLALANALFGLLVVPESLPKEKRRPFSIKRANPIGAFGQMRQYPMVLSFMGVAAFYYIGHESLPSTWTYYTMFKFDWDERMVGYSMGAVGIAVAIAQGWLIRAAIPALGERRAVLIGFACLALGFIGFSLASASWQMFAFILPFAIGGIAMPALRSMLAAQVPENAQGELQGALSSLSSLMAIVAPLFMTQIFGFFSSPEAPIHFPGASFMAAGVLVIFSLLVFARVSAKVDSSTAPLEVAR